MIQISTAQLWVHDQDEALAFWTEKVGFEVRQDVTVAEMGNFRWLTVGPVGQARRRHRADGHPRATVIDEATATRSPSSRRKGFAGTIFLTTDDCDEGLRGHDGRGVEFTEKPTEQPYGIDCGFRDPSGNNIRLAQLMPMG